MHNEPTAAVRIAMEISSALSKLFFHGRHTDIEGVYMVFAGFNGMQAAAELSSKARGKIFFVPDFALIDEEVVLQKVLVVDGISSPDATMLMICDPVRHPAGSFGLLSDLKGKTVEFRCLNETQMIRQALRRPRNAAKLIERGRRAVAEAVAVSPALAA